MASIKSVCFVYCTGLGHFIHSVLAEWRHLVKSAISRHILEGGREQAVDSYCEKLACVNFEQSTYIYLGNKIQKEKLKSPFFY